MERGFRGNRRAFTLLELMIVLVIMAFLSTPFLLMARLAYVEYHRLMGLGEFRQAANRLRVMLERDLRNNRGLILAPDNQGLSITTRDGERVPYRLDLTRGRILRKGEPLFHGPQVTGLILFAQGDRLVVNLELQEQDPLHHRPRTFKDLFSLPAGGAS